MVYLEPNMLLIQQSENEFEEGALEIRLKLQLQGEIYRPDSFCNDATLLCKFESDKIWINEFE